MAAAPADPLSVDALLETYLESKAALHRTAERFDRYTPTLTPLIEQWWDHIDEQPARFKAAVDGLLGPWRELIANVAPDVDAGFAVSLNRLLWLQDAALDVMDAVYHPEPVTRYGDAEDRPNVNYFQPGRMAQRATWDDHSDRHLAVRSALEPAVREVCRRLAWYHRMTGNLPLAAHLMQWGQSYPGPGPSESVLEARSVALQMGVDHGVYRFSQSQVMGLTRAENAFKRLAELKVGVVDHPLRVAEAAEILGHLADDYGAAVTAAHYRDIARDKAELVARVADADSHESREARKLLVRVARAKKKADGNAPDSTVPRAGTVVTGAVVAGTAEAAASAARDRLEGHLRSAERALGRNLYGEGNVRPFTLAGELRRCALSVLAAYSDGLADAAFDAAHQQRLASVLDDVADFVAYVYRWARPEKWHGQYLKPTYAAAGGSHLGSEPLDVARHLLRVARELAVKFRSNLVAKIEHDFARLAIAAGDLDEKHWERAARAYSHRHGYDNRLLQAAVKLEYAETLSRHHRHLRSGEPQPDCGVCDRIETWAWDASVTWWQNGRHVLGVGADTLASLDDGGLPSRVARLMLTHASTSDNQSRRKTFRTLDRTKGNLASDVARELPNDDTLARALYRGLNPGGGGIGSDARTEDGRRDDGGVAPVPAERRAGFFGVQGEESLIDVLRRRVGVDRSVLIVQYFGVGEALWGQAWYRSPTGTAVAAPVRLDSGAADQIEAFGAAPLDSNLDMLHTLYTTLVAPLVASVRLGSRERAEGEHEERRLSLDDVDVIVVVPEPSRPFVPFHALIPDGRGGEPLFVTHDVALLPNLRLFEAPQFLSFDDVNDDVLLLGYHDEIRASEEVAALAGTAAASRLRPHTPAEENAVAALASPAGYGLIHIASHGYYSPKPLDSYLKFPRLELSALRLLHVRPRADLVVLNVCGSPDNPRRARELFGLPFGFFASGSRSVITTLARVRTEAAYDFGRHLAGTLFGAHADRSATKLERYTSALRALYDEKSIGQENALAATLPYLFIGDPGLPVWRV